MHHPADAVHRLKHIQILIAEDDPGIRKLLQTTLHAMGFNEILLASDGMSAIEILRQQPVDLLITDRRMKPMDGIALTHYLRTAPESPDRFLPILMVSGMAEHQDVLAARDAGITEFLVKPFSVRHLAERLQAIVDNPRHFVESDVFQGPDRRRRRAGGSGEDRRKNRHTNP